MTYSNGNRLDRIEGLLEAIATRQAELASLQSEFAIRQEQYEMRQEKADRRVAARDDSLDSNTRSIEALSDNFSKWQQEAQGDRKRLYEAMADLAAAQSGYYSRLEKVDQRQDQLSRRQGEIVEILKLLTQPKQPPDQ